MSKKMITGIILIAIGVILMAVFGAVGNYFIQNARTELGGKNTQDIIDNQDSSTSVVIENSDTNKEEVIKNIDSIDNKINKASPIIEHLGFEAKNRQFFQEEGNNYEGFNDVFPFGYYGIYQSPEFEEPFKKAFGNIEQNEIIDFSKVLVRDPSSYGRSSEIILKTKYKSVSGSSLSDGNESGTIFFHPQLNKKLQVLMTMNYGTPKYELYTVVITLNPKKPYSYVIGPIDIIDLKKREVYSKGKLIDFNRK